jgi:prolyl-tRNA synthetase
MLVRRDTRQKRTVPLTALAAAVETLLAEMQADLFTAASRMRDQHTAAVDTYESLAERVATNAGWSLAHWCGGTACEAQVKAETKATIRCIPRDQPREAGRCIVCGGSSDCQVIFARAY